MGGARRLDGELHPFICAGRAVNKLATGLIVERYRKAWKGEWREGTRGEAVMASNSCLKLG